MNQPGDDNSSSETTDCLEAIKEADPETYKLLMEVNQGVASLGASIDSVATHFEKTNFNQEQREVLREVFSYGRRQSGV